MWTPRSSFPLGPVTPGRVHLSSPVSLSTPYALSLPHPAEIEERRSESSSVVAELLFFSMHMKRASIGNISIDIRRIRNSYSASYCYPYVKALWLVLIPTLVILLTTQVLLSSDQEISSRLSGQLAYNWREQFARLLDLFQLNAIKYGEKNHTIAFGSWILDFVGETNTSSCKVDVSELGHADFSLNMNKASRESIRHARHALEIVRQETGVMVNLDNAAFERSKSVDFAVLGKYNIWRHDFENQNSDSNVKFIRGQMILLRIYLGIAKAKKNFDIYRELQRHLIESRRTLGKAESDAGLNSSALENIKTLDHVLTKAKGQLYSCKTVTRKLRSMLRSAERNVRSLRKQSSFLSQLAAKTIPNSIHCLSMRLTIDYNLLPPNKREFPRSEKLEDPNLYHYALFSDNVLATSVVVNSAIRNAKEPEKHVFHLVTDKLNYGAMSMWFLLNPPAKATVYVENIDEFQWLNSSSCPVLEQLGSASMREFYFRTSHPSSISSGSSNLKYRNPKYLSMLNHLRFYLPQVYPKLDKILFLDDDIVVQKDLTDLWSIDLAGRVNGAVETCGASFHRFDKYLNFSNRQIAEHFDPNACGWAYGMNIFDLKEWKKRDITGIYHKWQRMNKERSLWKLGTLPPGLITFYGLTQPLDKSWHVLGLGYNPSIDPSEIENAAVVHYNGNLKPWLDIAITKYKSYWTKYLDSSHPYLLSCEQEQ